MESGIRKLTYQINLELPVVLVDQNYQANRTWQIQQGSSASNCAGSQSRPAILSMQRSPFVMIAMSGIYKSKNQMLI